MLLSKSNGREGSWEDLIHPNESRGSWVKNVGKDPALYPHSLAGGGGGDYIDYIEIV